ncbi:ABC transporter substrate-binding protein [Sphingomonas ginkgonis]|uniref:ABC transporter substrate-binding protein n=1 Tax=Sphingomonas ginkgonis TaxID=2315330 RepID=A0A429V8E8_9SPHN|nr:ABC transporter substrate-binding protein [Sphingomonas ginkgonis]RST30241.1 ABC transporter substrate-binding protein [Sphingomonas ginkgonis]
MRRLGIAGLLGALLLVGGCRQKADDRLDVALIGGPPQLVEPDRGQLTTADAVLLGATAQGLVQFDPAGNIVPGLAERWNVSSDGLSYIFRIAQTSWPDGRKVSAEDVVRLLKRQLRAASRNPLKDTAGAIDEIQAMTDRVVDIELRGPRPNLLQLLAQPEFALLRDQGGTGPFRIRGRSNDGRVELGRETPGPDGEPAQRERAVLAAQPASLAIARFASGTNDLVLGGTFADLPLAQAARLPRNTLRYDPAAGLFGLVPARRDGPIADPRLRDLLNRAIDRTALVAALDVPDLAGRATILQFGLDGLGDPPVPPWLAEDPARRRAELLNVADQLFGKGKPRPVLLLDIPVSPGGRIVIDALRASWRPLGIRVLAAGPDATPDLRLVDRVAPSTSPAWFLRTFRCEFTAVCNPLADTLLDAARDTPVAAQRGALFGQAAALMEAQTLFLPIAAPVRWSLVSRDLPGFQENRFARHPLSGMTNRNGNE